ncbi:MAG: hypothetical protein ABI608_04875 [Rhizomicrobium sp.]
MAKKSGLAARVAQLEAMVLSMFSSKVPAKAKKTAKRKKTRAKKTARKSR